MQLPYQQTTNEEVDLVALEIAMRVAWTKADAFLGLFELRRWIIKRCPDDAPPSLHAYIDDEEIALLVAMAMSCPKDPDKLLRALTGCTPPFLEKREDGRYWLVDAKRYDATWLKNRTRAGPVREAWTKFLAGTGPEPTHSRSGSQPVPSGKRAESDAEPTTNPHVAAPEPTRIPDGVRRTSGGHPAEGVRIAGGLESVSGGHPAETPPEPSPQTQTQTQTTTSVSLRETARPASPVALPSKNSKDLGKGKAKDKPPPNPRHGPMRERLKAAFRELRGVAYGWSARDAGALDWMLDQEPDDEAIVARWRMAIDPGRTSFPPDIANLYELLPPHWNRFVPPQAPPPPEPDTTGVPAPERSRGTDEAESAWTDVLADVRESGKQYAVSWLDRLTPVRIAAGALELAADDGYFRDWAEEHYGGLLGETAERTGSLTVRIVVAEPGHFGPDGPRPTPVPESFSPVPTPRLKPVPEPEPPLVESSALTVEQTRTRVLAGRSKRKAVLA